MSGLKKFEKFIDDTAFIWFFILVTTVGLVKWLIVWTLYEILMMTLLNYTEKEKEEKKEQEENEKDIINEDKIKKTYI